MQLEILDIRATASLGAHPWEHNRPRPIRISLRVEYDGLAASQSDALADALDYDALTRLALEVALRRHYNLVESLLSELGAEIIRLRGVQVVDIEIEKPGAVPAAGSVRVRERFRP